MRTEEILEAGLSPHSGALAGFLHVMLTVEKTPQIPLTRLGIVGLIHGYHRYPSQEFDNKRCEVKTERLVIPALVVLAMALAAHPALAQDEEAGEDPSAGAAFAPGEEAPDAEPEEAGEAAVEEAVEEAEEPAAEEAPVEEPPAEEPPAAEEPPPSAAAGAAVEAEAGAGAEATLEAEAAPKKKAIWRNTLFIYENAVSAYSFDKDAELTYNPYYAMSYSFIPRFYLYKGMSLRVNWAFEQELTNSDTTTKKHEVYWTDVNVDWVWGGAATIPGVDVMFTPKLRVTLPASKASQARTLYVALGPGFDFLKSFDVLGGITLQWAFRYTKYFNKYSGPVSEEPLLECPGSQAKCPYYALGNRNPSHAFTNAFLIEIRPIDSLYLAVQVAVINRLLYKNTEATVDIIGGSYEVRESSQNSNHSGLMQYVFEIGYDVLPFMSIGLGSNTYNPMLAPKSEYYAPFFNRYTTLYLDFVFYPEVLITNLVEGRKRTLEKDYF